MTVPTDNPTPYPFLASLVDAINADLDRDGGVPSPLEPIRYVTEDMALGAYAVTSLSYEILGLAPIGGDPNVDAILSRIPPERGDGSVIVGVSVHPLGDPDPESKGKIYWIVDFNDMTVMTEDEAYRRYAGVGTDRTA